MQGKYSFSVFWKIISYFLLLICLYPIIGSLTGYIEFSKTLIILWSVLLILPIISIYVFSTSFIIDNDKVGYKYPFQKQKIIMRHDIDGYYIKPGDYLNEVVFINKKNNTKVKISVSGKKMVNALNEFIVNISNMVIEKTYNEIKNHGLTITRFSKKGIFFIDESGITVLKTKEKIDWKVVTKIKITEYGAFLFYEIIANKKIKFNQINTNGCVGIGKYLNEKAIELKIV